MPPKDNGKISVQLLLFSTALALGFFYFDLLIPLGIAGGIPYTALIALSVWSPQRTFTHYLTILSTVLIATGYFLTAKGDIYLMVVMNRFLSLAAVWVTSILIVFWKRSEEERVRLESVLTESQEEVKILSGLLPICASCKKIRDDEGLWNQVEEYIHEHSEAQFSHGLCPDCMKKLYPEYVK